MCLVNSNIIDSIKQTYKNIALIMLQEKRDGTEKSEYDFLCENEP